MCMIKGLALVRSVLAMTLSFDRVLFLLSCVRLRSCHSNSRVALDDQEREAVTNASRSSTEFFDHRAL